jgi:hypothetical protein
MGTSLNPAKAGAPRCKNHIEASAARMTAKATEFNARHRAGGYPDAAAPGLRRAAPMSKVVFRADSAALSTAALGRR